MAKAAYWTITDVEARKRGEQTGLDTLMGQSEITAAAAVQPNPRDATALSEQTAVQIPALAGTA